MPRISNAKNCTLNLRVTEDFKERLAEKAAAARRSVTNYLEVTLLDLWEEEGQKTKAPRIGRH
jgi:predicted HicB family RNase H-like nuclease